MRRSVSSFVRSLEQISPPKASPAHLRRLLALLAAGAWPVWVLAGTTSGDLPWNNFLDKLQDNITGPTATALIFIAIAGALVVWSMSDDHRGLIRFGKALGALAILAGLATLLTTLNITGATV